MAAAAPGQVLSFRAGGRAHAVAADAVREIVRLPRLTPVPHAPKGLAGLGNVRGSAVPILSVGALEDLPARSQTTVLVLAREPAVGLLVDEVTAIEPARKGLKRLDVDALLAEAYRQAPVVAGARRADRVVASPVAPAATEAQVHLIAFAVAGQAFALPLDQVEEVIALPGDVVPVPRSDPAVAGTTLHRGALLPLLRLAHLLGLGGAEGPAIGARVVIVNIQGRRVGLVVGAVIRLGEHAIDPVPAVIARRSAEARIQAIGRLPDGRGLISILAADQLLDEALMAQLDERSSDTEIEQMAAEQHERFLLFRLGDQSFGLPALAVTEVVRIPDAIVRIPRAPAFIEGVMSLRGHAVPVIDQRRRFGSPAAAIAGKRAILLAIGALKAAFVVDSVDDVRPIAHSAIGAAPEMGAGPQLFDRVASLDDGERMVLLIEPAQLLDGAERDLLAALAAQADVASA
ncbi:chemotaxis protein CheW [Sphingomonas nostoxanthinifaciens]|uniref:chemotaxis protein CheW n=1 Tax=Sphingomonas nostoxanthinifaciens TaxID=2872652 RepID=UPI001CC1EA81|nr:chemotaxis protein CheW [Sphingomonas nostoxanthinifaciens]UAK24278.1 chemotaxis protein CheW [Sphingomonas nostoxanthinifaciens]